MAITIGIIVKCIQMKKRKHNIDVKEIHFITNDTLGPKEENEIYEKNNISIESSAPAAGELY